MVHNGSRCMFDEILDRILALHSGNVFVPFYVSFLPYRSVSQMILLEHSLYILHFRC